MLNDDNSYLIEQLINNNLSSTELDKFLAGLYQADAVQTYSDVLETLFDELLKQNEHQPDFDQKTDS